MTAPVLEVRNLTVDIPLENGMLHAVRDISFDVAKGETLCIVGESGCGKSLTSLAVMGLLPKKAQRGATTLSFGGQDISGLSERGMSRLRGDRMAMIFQEPMTSLNPAYTIGDQLTEVLIAHRSTSRKAARDRAIHLLERVGITAAERRLTQYPHQLSGGLRQRVMIAMALMCGPELIIADEPTTALDVTIQAQILHLLIELKQEIGLSLVLITHDLGVVARVADKVAVMYAGEFVETGAVGEIFADPRHPYTRGLLDCVPAPGVTKPGELLGTIPGVVPSLIGEMKDCGFRERCTLAHEACRKPIALHQLSEGRACRCVLAEERAA
ncbi:MAG: ABC transporter ATP-binding protein [Paracoccaceae bacterium]